MLTERLSTALSQVCKPEVKWDLELSVSLNVEKIITVPQLPRPVFHS